METQRRQSISNNHNHKQQHPQQDRQPPQRRKEQQQQQHQQRGWSWLLLACGISLLAVDMILLECSDLSSFSVSSSITSISTETAFWLPFKQKQQQQQQPQFDDQLQNNRLGNRQQQEQELPSRRQRSSSSVEERSTTRSRRPLPSQSTMDFLQKVGLLDLLQDDKNISVVDLNQQVDFLMQHWHVIQQRLGGTITTITNGDGGSQTSSPSTSSSTSSVDATTTTTSGPKIIGLETCATFRNLVPLRRRIIAPAGIFNSGTNLLSKLLYDNCWISPPQRHIQPYITRKADHPHIHWQVNWGKHTPAMFRSNYSIDYHFNNQHFLPIVMIRDPYSWFQTMCRVRYSVHWFHHAAEHCPNFVPNHVDQKWFYKVLRNEIPYTKQHEPWLWDNLHDLANYTPDLDHVPVRVRFKAGNLYFHNLADVWNFWYHAYYSYSDFRQQPQPEDQDVSSSTSSSSSTTTTTTPFPRLMIRLEDLVIYPVQVITQVCECVGGHARSAASFRHAVDSAKPGDENVHGTVKTNRLDAMIKLIQENRTAGMTNDDYHFAQQHLSSTLLQAFSYSHPL